MLGRGSGSVLLTGGNFALAPHPGYLSISIGKAHIRAVAEGLFDRFRGHGLHVATVTSRASSALAPNTQSIADPFWTLHAQPWKARTVGTILEPTGA